MSYIDQDRKYGRSSIAAVALLHLGIGYAVYSGLAYTVIPFVDRPIIAQIFKDPPPPPPHDLPPPRSTPQPRTVTAEPKLVDMTPRLDATGSFPLQSPVTPPILPAARVVTPPPLPPARASLARGATPGPSRAGWVTSDDYPPSALRENVEGVVGITVAIGADGRVTDCAVTATSGNAALDQASCRYYARRARFSPALDDAGKPVASTHADRVRWQIPRQ